MHSLKVKQRSIMSFVQTDILTSFKNVMLMLRMKIGQVTLEEKEPGRRMSFTRCQINHW